MTLQISQAYSNELTQDKLDLLKQTICKGASDDEFQLFVMTCKRTGLDPFMKQIHAVFRKTKQPDGSWKPTMTIQPSIDGMRLIADRTGKYAPGREPSFKYDDKGNIISATAYVKKLCGDGSWHEVAATAFYCEYVQKDNQGQPLKFWAAMQHNMLAKCAESLAIRKAFPADTSGLYTEEEMLQANNPAPIQLLECSTSECEEIVRKLAIKKESFQRFMGSYHEYQKAIDPNITLERCYYLIKDNLEEARNNFKLWFLKQPKKAFTESEMDAFMDYIQVDHELFHKYMIHCLPFYKKKSPTISVEELFDIASQDPDDIKKRYEDWKKTLEIDI